MDKNSTGKEILNLEAEISDCKTKCGVIGIVGRTNGGKSTLLNQLVGEKVSIVSHVVQTTRNSIRAVLDERRGQLVFVDTPGLHKAESKLGTLINRMARHAASNVDILLLVMDVSHAPKLEDDGWMRRILGDEGEQPVVFFLNKTDKKENHSDEFKKLWNDIQEEMGKKREVMVFSGSAMNGDGTKKLVDHLFSMTNNGPRLYDPDIISDYPRRLAIADIIREKLINNLHDELPHEVGVRVDDFKETQSAWKLEVSILVNRASQKPIIIGKKGETIRKVQRAAQKDIAEQFDVRVELDLWVKISKDWSANNFILKQMGYLGDY